MTIGVALITPMKRGLKVAKIGIKHMTFDKVALITPMKRGLKVQGEGVHAGVHDVALITPMKRGLKDLNSPSIVVNY